MAMFVFSFLVFCVALVAMAVGVLMRGKCIDSSCGGLARLQGFESRCDVCDKQCNERTDLND